MELKSSTLTACFFVFLILSLPSFSQGGREILEKEMYEIDYRGPETHKTPPDQSPYSPDHPRTSLAAPKMDKNHKKEEVKKIGG